MPEDRRLPPWLWEVAFALLLLFWRILWYPVAGLWQDWVVILSLYWIFMARVPKSRTRDAFTLGVMLALFLVYAVRQVPLTLDLLRSVL